MPDITLCTDNKCPMRNECYCFRAKPSKWGQSYFAESPLKDGKCEYFFPLEEGMILKDMNDE